MDADYNPGLESHWESFLMCIKSSMWLEDSLKDRLSSNVKAHKHVYNVYI